MIDDIIVKYQDIEEYIQQKLQEKCKRERISIETVNFIIIFFDVFDSSKCLDVGFCELCLQYYTYSKSAIFLAKRYSVYILFLLQLKKHPNAVRQSRRFNKE